MAGTGQTRRRVLGALIAAAAAVPLWRFLSARPAAEQAVLRVERAQIPADGALVYRQSRVAVMRAGDEIYALSLTCTHLGCIVNVTPGGLVCPCHGSTFDRRGEVLSGPATRRLDRFAVRVEGDHVVVLS
jgi:Rieske Fe-S protein